MYSFPPFLYVYLSYTHENPTNRFTLLHILKYNVREHFQKHPLKFYDFIFLYFSIHYLYKFHLYNIHSSLVTKSCYFFILMSLFDFIFQSFLHAYISSTVYVTFIISNLLFFILLFLFYFIFQSFLQAYISSTQHLSIKVMNFFYFILFWCIFLILYFNLSYMHTFHLYNIHPLLL